MVTAARRTSAVTMYFEAAVKPKRPMPLSIPAMTIPPSTPWIALPRPPKRLVPPMTAAGTPYSTKMRTGIARDDDRGGHRVQSECAAVNRGRDRPQARRVHDARNSGGERAKEESCRPDLDEIDAGATQGLGAAADRIEVAPERRSSEQERPGHEHADDEEDNPGH